MIVAAVRLRSKPETRDELARHVRERMLEPTRREAGCIRYSFYQDVQDPDAFVFAEEWADWDALNAHFRSDHVGELLASADHLLAAPPEGGFHEIGRSRGVDAIADARGLTA
jgi:quinol monooxygenase YgiN